MSKRALLLIAVILLGCLPQWLIPDWHGTEGRRIQIALEMLRSGDWLVPTRGGDTMFSNGYLAYDHLSAPMRALLGSVRTFNVGDGFRRGVGMASRAERYAKNPQMQAKLKDPGNVPTESVHPLIRTHPETGRKAVYIGSHTRTLDGFKDGEADPIIEYLRTHTTRPEFTCRFRWEKGSLALWDNRCCQHLALADYNERRRMHRITIAGDTPF